MGDIIRERLGTILTSLVIAFIAGGIGVVVSQAVANEKINNLEKKQAKQEVVLQEGLEKIDKKLDKIVDAIQEQSIDAAKYHHDHPR